MSPTRLIAVVAAALTLVSCSQNADSAKKRYLASGNKYFDRGKFKEARIMYKDALQKDQRYGPAWYRLGLTAIRTNSVNESVQSFRRAIETLPADSDDRFDSMSKLADVMIHYGKDSKQLLDEVENICNTLLKRDPNSYDGNRLMGDMNFNKASQAFKAARKTEGMAAIDTAVGFYDKANQIKPNTKYIMLQLARASAIKGDLPEAEKLYRAAVAIDNTDATAYTELYRLLLVEKKPDEGEKVLKDAFAANPKQYVYLSNLALHYQLMQRRDDMIRVLEEIKSHAKEYEQAYLVVGDFYLRLGDGDMAIKEYTEGQEKDAKRKSTYQKRIIEVLMRQGKRDKAAQITADILKADPKDIDAKQLSAAFMLDKGDVNSALAELQAVVTRAPDNAIARYNLGRAHLALGQVEQARQMFTKAIELRPDLIQARMDLARLQVGRGEFEAALKTAEDILNIDRGNVNARLLESAALLGQRKFSESRAILDSMLKAYPNAPEVYFQLGVVALAENKFKEADAAFQKSYQLNPANPRGLMGMVETSIAENKPDQALQLLRSEADKSPNQLDLRMALANTAVRAGKYDMAIGEYEKVLNSLDKGATKSRGDVLLRLGETYRRKGDDANAISTLQQARQAIPDNGVVLSTLALALDHSGNWTEAKTVYEAAIKQDQNNGIALNNLAFLMAEHNGDADDALAKATRAKQLLPNMSEVSDTLGWIYLKKSMPDSAIEIFTDLVKKAPDQATFRYHLGMAFNQKGDKTRAVKELQEALKYHPTKVEQDKIQDLLRRLNGAA